MKLDKNPSVSYVSKFPTGASGQKEPPPALRSIAKFLSRRVIQGSLGKLHALPTQTLEELQGKWEHSEGDGSNQMS